MTDAAKKDAHAATKRARKVDEDKWMGKEEGANMLNGRAASYIRVRARARAAAIRARS